MKKGWELKKLKEVCRLVNGRAYKKAELLSNGKYPVLRVGNLFTNKQWYFSNLELDDHKYCDKGDLIYAWSASFGPRIWEGDKVIYHYHIWKVLPNLHLIHKDFLFHLFEWDKEMIKSAHGTGTTMMHVGKTSMENRIVPIPPLTEQKQIVAILDKAFAAIDQAKANIEKNIQNAKELFQSKLNEIFSQRGEGWKESELQEVCEKITDGTHQTPKYFDEGVVFLSSKNVTTGKIDWDNIKYIDEEQHVKMHKRIAPKLKDILLAKNGTTGVAAMVDRDVTFDIYVSLAHIRSLGEILPEYMLHYINSPMAKKQFNKRLKGMGVPNLHLKEIREVKIYYPTSIDEQNTFVAQLDLLKNRVDSILNSYESKLYNVDEVKKSILQQAFAGELT